MSKIGFAGDGHGAIAAFKSLQNLFSVIEFHSTDQDVIDIARNSDTAVDMISDLSSRLVVCAGYKPIIRKEFLESHQVINVHYSLLPKYRGLHAVVWAILNGEEHFGYTLHLMDEEIDSGPMIFQKQFRYQNETSHKVMNICNTSVEKELGHIVQSYLRNEIVITSQDKLMATWVARRNQSDCFIDFSWNTDFLRRFFKAMVSPYPLPMLRVSGEVYEVVDYDILDKDYYTHIGRVVNIDSEGVWIKVNGGILVLKKLQRKGVIVDAFSKFKIGQRLAL
jgi:methionyl-tRNA formyltransferase